MPFNISSNLSQSWHLVKGVKGPICLTLLTVIIGFMALMSVPFAIRFFHINIEYPNILSAVMIILGAALTAPFSAGLNMIAIKQARGEPVTLRTGFSYFNKWLPVAVIYIIMASLAHGFSSLIRHAIILLFPNSLSSHFITIALIGMLISVVFFILIYCFFFLAVPLIVDQNLSVLSAIRRSFLVTKQNWLKITGLNLILYAFALISVSLTEIPLVGLVCYTILFIWLMPFLVMNIGVAYHQLIDRENHAQSLMPSD